MISRPKQARFALNNELGVPADEPEPKKDEALAF